jgi:hypothetical protein
MNTTLPLQIRMFNERVRAMTQSHAKILTLTQAEAQGLHAEIYELMATIAEQANAPKDGNLVAQVSMDGGGFR